MPPPTTSSLRLPANQPACLLNLPHETRRVSARRFPCTLPDHALEPHRARAGRGRGGAIGAGSVVPSVLVSALRLCAEKWRLTARRGGYHAGIFTHVLTSDFIARAEPTKGRFRSFLLASLRHFMAKVHARESAQKRGGGVRPVDFDENAAEERLGLTAGTTERSPSEQFERDWALALLEQALDRLGAEQRAMGKANLFVRVRSFLRAGPERGDYEALASEMGMSKGTLTVTVHRLQQRYRELVRTEIMQTIADPADLDDELRHLLSILQS